jgi:hypothetical protein
MNEQEQFFSQLKPNEQAALSAFYKEALETNFRESRNAAWELAKVLLTVNSGAAAGLFFVVRSSAENSVLIASFYTFCFGVFFVVAAYFVGAVQFAGGALKWEEEIQKVLQDKLSPLALIRGQRKRVRGKWSKTCCILGGFSFLCILVSGIMTGIFLIKAPQQISHQINSPPNHNSSLTNSITSHSAH